MAIPSAQQTQLFVNYLRAHPESLWQEEFAPIREYLIDMGATKLPPKPEPVAEPEPEEEEDDDDLPDLETAPPIPQEQYEPESDSDSEEEEEEEEPMSESEDEVEEDDPDVLKTPDVAPELPLPPNVEVTEEAFEKSQTLKMEAMELMSNAQYDQAIDVMTQAINMNPKVAMLHAFRAQIFLKQKRPNAAIRDCDEALGINPDSAKAYIVKGRAHALLGQWKASAKNFHEASQIDVIYDPDIQELVKKVEGKANVIEERRRKKEKRAKIREEREMKKKLRKRQRAHEKAAKRASKENKETKPGVSPGARAGGPGGMPGMGGMGGIDEETLKLMQSERIRKILEEISADPSKINQYMEDEEVMKVLIALQQMQGGGGGGMPGGMGGMPGMSGMGGGGMGGMNAEDID